MNEKDQRDQMNHSACVRRHAEFHPGYLWEGVHNPKQFSVLGLLCGASMRCRLLLGLLSVLAHSSNPTVALTRSSRIAFPALVSPPRYACEGVLSSILPHIKGNPDM